MPFKHYKLNPPKINQVKKYLQLNYTIKQISLETGVPEDYVRKIKNQVL